MMVHIRHPFWHRPPPLGAHPWTHAGLPLKYGIPPPPPTTHGSGGGGGATKATARASGLWLKVLLPPLPHHLRLRRKRITRCVQAIAFLDYFNCTITNTRGCAPPATA